MEPSPERLVRWVTAGLVVLLAYVLAQGTWQLLPGESPSKQPRNAVRAVAPAQAPPQARLAEVADLHLFGQPPRQQQRMAVPVETPETRLNLVLRGVFATDRPEEGGAIIADPGGIESFYGSGDRLPGGAELKAVYGDRVILARAGQFETLKWPEEPRSGILIEKGGRSQGDSTPELQSYRDRILENPSSALDLIRLQRISENGQIKGYRVAPGKERELFEQVGLQTGDVVTHVNGISVADPGRFREVYEQLTSASQLQLQVEREGLPHQIAVSFN